MFWSLFIAAKKKEVQEEETEGPERRKKSADPALLFSLLEPFYSSITCIPTLKPISVAGLL